MSQKADLLAQACIAELIESGATNYHEDRFVSPENIYTNRYVSRMRSL